MASQVLLHDGTDFAVKRTFRPSGYSVEAAAYAPDRGKLVAGGSDMWVHVYDETDSEVEAGRGHHGPVHGVRFAPGHATFASGSEDGTLRIWQTEPPAAAVAAPVAAKETRDGQGV